MHLAVSPPCCLPRAAPPLAWSWASSAPRQWPHPPLLASLLASCAACVLASSALGNCRTRPVPPPCRACRRGECPAVRAPWGKVPPLHACAPSASRMNRSRRRRSLPLRFIAFDGRSPIQRHHELLCDVPEPRHQSLSSLCHGNVVTLEQIIAAVDLAEQFDVSSFLAKFRSPRCALLATKV